MEYVIVVSFTKEANFVFVDLKPVIHEDARQNFQAFPFYSWPC